MIAPVYMHSLCKRRYNKYI